MEERFILFVLMTVVGLFCYSVSSAETYYRYSASCRLVPEKMELEGSCTVSFSVRDTLIGSSILIYAQRKPDNDKYYYSENVMYNEDPIIEKENTDWIELHQLIVDGDTIDLSTLKRENELLRFTFKKKKDLGSRVTVKTTFTTHILNCKDDIVFLLDPWLPIIASDGDKELSDIPNRYDYSIDVPADYQLLASGFIEGEDSKDGDTVYHVKDPNISVPYWIASPKIRLLKKVDASVRYEIYSTCGPYPEGAIDELEEQVAKLYDFFGKPVGDRQNLSFVLLPIHMSGLGGANGGNIVFINKIYYKSPVLSNFYPHLLLHELLHYWFINRVYGELTDEDALFHECFVRNTADMLSMGSLAVERRRKVKGVSRLFGFLKNISHQVDTSPQRGGYHFSVFKSKNVDEIVRTEKGAAALNAISLQFPRDEWEKKVLRYFKAVKGKEAITFELFCRQNPDIAKYLTSWFEEPKDFDYALGRVESRPIGAGRYASIVEVINKGGIMSPCPVRIDHADGSSEMKTVAVSLVDTIGETTSSPVTRVTLDPGHTVPDYDRSNNRNYMKVRFEQSIFHPGNDGCVASINLLPLPMYSELSGWVVSSNILSINGSNKSFGVAGLSRNAVSMNGGYNFRANRFIWSVNAYKSLEFPTDMSALHLNISEDPELRFYSLALTSNFSKSFNEPPIEKVSCFTEYENLYKPSYRNREDWTSGYNLFIGTLYSYRNTKTLVYPVKGDCIRFVGGKAFDLAGTDWNYEKLSVEACDYRLMPFFTVLGNRLFVGNIRGVAPIQESFDAARDALFASYPVYKKNGYRLIALDTELRIRKRLPIFDTAIYFKNAWMQDYGESVMSRASELGISLRTNRLSMSFDITMLSRGFDGTIDRHPYLQFKMGVPFDYSKVRWVSSRN